MIDTVILLLSKKKYTITIPDNFSPSASWILKSNLYATHNLKSVQFPNRSNIKNNLYKPRLTLSHRNNIDGILDTILKIELSLPKLMFGNNFMELRYKDLNAVAAKLHQILATMGVETTVEALKQAPVTTVHYAKNIVLTGGTTSHYLISKLQKMCMPKNLDTNQTDYRNGGHAFKWHCNSYEIVLYDKMYDLAQAQKSNKRAIEKDNNIQLKLFEKLQKKQLDHKFEIFRMEVRLNTRAKIKQLFKKLGVRALLTFNKLYKPAISRKVLLHYLDTLEKQQLPFFDLSPTTTDKNLLSQLIIHNPHLSTTKVIQLFGFKRLLEIMTMQELQQMFAHHHQRSLQRLLNDARTLVVPGRIDTFDVIKKQVQKNKALKL